MKEMKEKKETKEMKPTFPNVDQDPIPCFQLLPPVLGHQQALQRSSTQNGKKVIRRNKSRKVLVSRELNLEVSRGPHESVCKVLKKRLTDRAQDHRRLVE